MKTAIVVISIIFTGLAMLAIIGSEPTDHNTEIAQAVCSTFYPERTGPIAKVAPGHVDGYDRCIRQQIQHLRNGS